MEKINIMQIIKNGGATLNKNGVEVNFKNGYQVSKKDCYTIKVKDIDKILKAVNKILKSIKANEFCGLWCDNGLCYVDISERIKNFNKAMRLAKSRKQISVYAWSIADCIAV